MIDNQNPAGKKNKEQSSKVVQQKCNYINTVTSNNVTNLTTILIKLDTCI